MKADKESVNLKQLQAASKGVASATATVVASAKTGAEMVDDSGRPRHSNYLVLVEFFHSLFSCFIV